MNRVKEYNKAVLQIVGTVASLAAMMGLQIPWLEDPQNAVAVAGVISFLFVLFGPGNKPWTGFKEK